MTLAANETLKKQTRVENFLTIVIDAPPDLPCFNVTARHCKYQFTVSVHPRGSYYHYTGIKYPLSMAVIMSIG